jgi:Skp family chaperone for outer membrane proteins
MHRTRLIVGALLVLVPGLVTVIACQSYAIGHMAASPTAVATVNIDKVFGGLNERAQIDTRLMTIAEDLTAQSEALAEQIDELQEELEMYTPGSDKHQGALEQYTLKGLEYQAFGEFSMMKLDVHKATEFRRVFESISGAVSILAIELGYDIVMVDDSVNPIGGGNDSDAVRLNIMSRQILYANGEVDLTDVLTERMNQP